MTEFTDLRDKLDKLESQVFSHDSKLTQQQKSIDTTNNNVQQMQKTVQDHSDKLSECTNHNNHSANAKGYYRRA